MISNILNCPLRFKIENLLLINIHGFKECIAVLIPRVVSRKRQAVAWLHRCHCILKQKNK